MDEILKALKFFALHYEVAAIVDNLDIGVEIDLDNDDDSESIRLRDRDVLLVKNGIKFSKLIGDFDFERRTGGLCGVPVANPLSGLLGLPPNLESEPSRDGCTFTVVAEFPSPVGEIQVKRGFVGIDATVRGKEYRIVNTHLEIFDPIIAAVQSLQAVQLVGTLQATTPPDLALILLGDFNSAPEDTTGAPIGTPYQINSAKGYHDVWNSNRIFRDGFTCCQLPDLSNRQSLLDTRIDQIWVDDSGFRSAFSYVSGRLRLPSLFPPKWASDHAGVVSRIRSR